MLRDLCCSLDLGHKEGSSIRASSGVFSPVDQEVKYMLKVQLHSVPAARVVKLVLYSPFLLPSSVPAELSLSWGQAAEPMGF